jgi:hypothetical protein
VYELSVVPLDVSEGSKVLREASTVPELAEVASVIVPVSSDTVSTEELKAVVVSEITVGTPDVVSETTSMAPETPWSAIVPVSSDTVSTEELKAVVVSEITVGTPDVVSETTSMAP